ncbi:MAG: serine hydrolase domain-containing protein, partial [Acidimicrobiia bacterium]
VLIDATLGEASPGRPLRPDDLMMWYSSSKPITTAAVLQLWERGRLSLDDPIGLYIPDWGAGKERCTIRHVLTHTGGFGMVGPGELFDKRVSYAEAVDLIAAYPAEYEPGTKAGYHPSSGWKILGAVVEAIDGRPISQYLHDEVLQPADMTESHLGIPVETQESLGDRIVPVHWKGHAIMVSLPDGVRMVEYHIEQIHNQDWHIAKAEPAGGIRGPARELGRFYESLLGYRDRVLEARTVEVMSAVHRHGLADHTFAEQRIPWGLGVQVAGGMSGGLGRRAFGHNGMASSRGMADPDLGLVLALVANGLPDPIRQERRLVQVTDTTYACLGEDAGRFRLPMRATSGTLRADART